VRINRIELGRGVFSVKMDKIAFFIKEDRVNGEAVGIRINGEDFIEIVRRYELPFARAEGFPFIAGDYTGLPPQDVLPPSYHFMAEQSNPLYVRGDKMKILTCSGCPQSECWPLYAEIVVEDDRVLWKGFEQPRRAGIWVYDKLGPFCFSREEYQVALDLFEVENNGRPSRMRRRKLGVQQRRGV